MGRFGQWMRFLAVAAGYTVAFFGLQRVMPFSLASPWFVVTAMICLLGLAFVAQPVVMLRMPWFLRSIRAREVHGGFYRAVGVAAFGRLLRRTPLRLFNMDVYLRNGLADTARVGAELEAAEASHLLAAVLVLPYMIYASLLGWWTALFSVSLAQALINVYPIMHLRLTRHRLDRLAAKRSLRPSAPTFRPPSS
jgi:Glycosyl-4,4'-diaponeurosporenoate acyltransferase